MGIEPRMFKMNLAMDEERRKKWEEKQSRNVCNFFDAIMFVENCPISDLSDTDNENCDGDVSDGAESDSHLEQESDSVSDSERGISFNLGGNNFCTNGNCCVDDNKICEEDEENYDE